MKSLEDLGGLEKNHNRRREGSDKMSTKKRVVKRGVE